MYEVAEPPLAISFSDRLDTNNLLDGCTAGAETQPMMILRVKYRQRPATVSGILLALFLAFGHTSSASAAAIPAPIWNAQQSGTAIVFYAQPQMKEDLWPALFEALHADLADGAGELLNGLALDKEPIFLRGSEDLRGVLFSKVISVKLLGRCDVFPQTDRPALRGPLGWVLQVSGKVQPFVSIDCARLAQVLRPRLIGLTAESRRYAMAQAIAHILIHEWIHIATQSSSHSARGIEQSNLSVDELIAGPKSNHLSGANR
jgi:hypothetical protein